MLFMTLHFSSESMVCLCRVNEQRQGEEMLADCELEDYSAMKSDRRRSEWLSARVALKKALLSKGIIDSPRQCEVKKNRLGRPDLVVKKGHAPVKMNCSISHKNGTAAVCIAWVPGMRVGVDLEIASDKLLRLQKAFVSNGDLLPAVSDERKYYTILWACKEAASKVMGLGLLADFKKLVITGYSDNSVSACYAGRRELHGNCFYFENFICATFYRIFPQPGKIGSTSAGQGKLISKIVCTEERI